MPIEHLLSLDETLVPPLRALLLLVVANGAPALGHELFGQWFSYPLDGGWRIFDGRPLFGPSKTLRGIVLSLAATAAAALVLGLPWTLGALLAGLSMAGDLTSSFIKRRLGLPPSSRALLLDPVPESLLPLLVFRARLSLMAWDIAVVVFVFFVLDQLLSRLLYKLHRRDRPY
ncbi:MAG TPA: CDP-archaeol synthase [Candidatus Methylomirabilis sp.]|nr:CDP-archaeol synthase [Candidatus Methylomirabilis sp.]